MKPAWDKLMEEFKDSKTGIVGDVDCTQHESLCNTHKVEGFPTIKYGKMGALKDYEGEREFADLQKFASQNLGPVCGPKSLDECDETTKKQIQEAVAMKDDVLQGKMKEKQDAVNKLEDDFSKEVDKLQAAKDAKVKEIMQGGLSSFKMVWDDRHPPPPPPPPEEEEGEEEGEGEEGDDPDGGEEDDGGKGGGKGKDDL